MLFVCSLFMIHIHKRLKTPSTPSLGMIQFFPGTYFFPPPPCYSSPCTTSYMRVTLIWIIFSYSDINYVLLFLDENVCISYFLSYIWEWMVVMLVISDKCSCFCKYTPLFSFIKEIINMVILILEMFESLQIQIWLLVSDESVLYFPTC